MKREPCCYSCELNSGPCTNPPRPAKRPTPRQVYLMRYMGPGHSFVIVSAFGTPSIIRHYEYARTAAERNPSRKEIDALVAAGWVKLRIDPNRTVTDTSSGKRTPGHRADLTKAGEECLSPFLIPKQRT